MFFFRMRRILTAARFRQRDARRGAVLGVLATLFIAVGTVLADPGADVLLVLLVGLLTSGLVVGLSELLPWRRLPRTALLLLPTAWLLGLAVQAVVVGPFASNFSGLIVLAFLYGGLTQEPWRSSVLLVVAVPVWAGLLLSAGTPAAAMLVRFPIALVIWLCVAEAVAARTSAFRTEMYRLNREIDKDPLTGLANRRALPDVLAGVRAGSAVCLIDIDHFKTVNDELGHATGDQVLAQFGRALRRCLGLFDVALRYGGEEFLVVLRDGGPDELARFTAALRVESRQIRPAVTHSVGIAVAGPGERAQEVLERADVALYSAKDAGRDRAVVHGAAA